MARHGENIRKRKDGRWEGRYIKGRRADKSAIWGYVYARSYTAVKRELTARKTAVQAYALSAENPTFRELSQHWESSIFLGVKASTLAHYRYTLQHYILPVLGSCRVQALDEITLERALTEIVSPTDKSHKTLGRTMAQECLVLVRRLCRYGAKRHLMRPMEISWKLPGARPLSVSSLTKKEQERVQKYILSAPSERKIGTLLMMQMGLRIGEVCGLQWGDFDLTVGTLSVNRTVKRIYEGLHQTRVVVQPPKTASSVRTLPIPTHLLQVLRKLRKAQPNAAWFLSGSTAKPVEPRCYRKSLRSYLKHAHVPAIHPHALRHTFATTCLQAGCNIKTLSELLGHAGPDITLKRYVHTCWAWKADEMNRIFSR